MYLKTLKEKNFKKIKKKKKNIYNYVFLQKLFFNCQLKSKFNLNGWIGNIPEIMASEIEGFFLSTKRAD